MPGVSQGKETQEKRHEPDIAHRQTGRPEDLKDIDTEDRAEVERLADELGVATTTLLAAIDTVGPRLDMVRDYLGK